MKNFTSKDMILSDLIDMALKTGGGGSAIYYNSKLTASYSTNMFEEVKKSSAYWN